jgi:hypothetical protein
MQIINQSFPFGPLSGSGPQTSSATVTFPSPVTQATAILTGFTAEYSGGNDHHLGRLQIAANVASISGANVVVNV